MTISHIWELPCYDGRKSFYGKAHVLEDSRGNAFLKSYDTIVCFIDSSGYFHRLWSGYSVTTQRHVDSFSLEIFCDVMHHPYWGPKKSLKWMEENHPTAFDCYQTALADFSVDSLENWIAYIKNASGTV